MVGRSIGPYTITAKLGEGGMGEVYRARDTRLDRIVALKILPELFASDPDRAMRFEREAKTLASLNHPHIAQIYGFEQSATASALVMELVEGEDLSQRIAQGPVAIDDALPIARQIAEALEAAHDQGIIHRDLKPANIKVRADGTVKVLDFGLAKALAQDTSLKSQHGTAVAATITSPAMTQAGMILGTAAYMSPEQAKGKLIDRRADLWAFGCVLFEMLTGTRAFGGEDVTDTLAQIVMGEPQWARLPASTPPAVHRLLRRCLQKDARQRLDSAAIARLELDDAQRPAEPIAVAATQPRVSRTAMLAIAAGAAFVGAAAGWLAPRNDPRVDAPKLSVEIPLPAAAGVAPRMMSVSPDGRWLAYKALDSDGVARLHFRDLSTNEDRVIPNMASALNIPAWSPSGQRFAIGSTQAVFIVDVTGFRMRERDVGRSVSGLTWLDDQEMVFTSNGDTYRARADGGEPVALPKAAGERRVMPAMLPDGRRYLFINPAAPERELRLGALDTAESSLLTRVSAFAYGRGKQVLIATGDGRLQVQAFDPAQGKLVGDLADLGAVQVATEWGIAASVTSVTAGGMVAFPTGAAQGSEFVWFDRAGQRGEQMFAAISGPSIDLSLDGKMGVAALIGERAGVLVLDLTRKLRSQLTTQAVSDPVISPDGSAVAYASRSTNQLLTQSALGGEPRVVYAPKQEQLGGLEHWSADGKYLVAMASVGSKRTVLRIPVDGSEQPLVLSEGLNLIDEMRLSPDGRWLAFNAAISDRNEIYVSPVPPTGERLQISTNGGVSARWRDDGRELYFLDPAGTLMAVSMTMRAARLEPSVPTPLFKTGVPPSYNLDHFAVGPGGKAFLVRLSASTNEVPTLKLLVNWFR